MDTLFSKLDPDQLAAVRLRRNGTVSAGAGSGKTTVLAARYLDLVLHGEAEGEGGDEGADIRSILCLTFTRKAAAEMRARIWRELSKSDSHRARSELSRFSEATITTIDSFCGSLLRSSAQRYGYAPDFRVDEVEARAMAVDEALRFVLEKREDPALRELFAHQGFMTAWRDLFGEAGHRYSTPAPERGVDLGAVPARARAALIRMAGDAARAIEEARGEAAELGDLGTAAGKDFIAALQALPSDLFALLPGKAGASGGTGPVAGESEALAAEGIARTLAELAERSSGLARLALRFGKGDGGQKDRLKAAAAAAREAARRLAACSEAAAQRGLEDRIVALVAEYADELKSAKREAGLMGFHDVLIATVDLLSREPAVRAWWKSRFRWIMVDEFQDDDEIQKDLFFLLAEREGLEVSGIPTAKDLAPDKLFFVGDDKQSIYRFRGADVAVFNRLGRELREGSAGDETSAGRPRTMPRLRTNYRSEPGLIAFYNAVFSRLLAGDGAEDFEARFEETIARKPTPGLEPSVSLLLKPKGEAGNDSTRSDDEALAEGLARHVEELVASKRCLVPDGEGRARAAGYDDIAILLRSSSKQYLVERFLRLHGIPHRAAAVRSLFVESPANDLLALLNLALVPSDRAALAVVLRSPFARLSASAFVAVLSHEGGLDAPDEELDLSAKDGGRIAALRGLLGALAARIDRLPLASLLSWIWHERGLRLSILADPVAHPFLEHFDWLFALAVAADRRGEGLAAFLDRVRPLLGTAEKFEEDIEAPREAKGGVQIMTIHKSKGLEFPIVILPWIENRGMGERKGPAWFESEEVGLTLNLRDWRDPKARSVNLFYEEASEREKARALAETKRLFYVACTRASAHLVFAGIRPDKEAADTSFFHFLGAHVEEGGWVLGPDGEDFAGLPGGIRLGILPDLSEEDYRRLAARPRGLSATDFAPAYAAAEPLERSRPSRVVPATAMALVAWEGDPRRGTPFPILPASAYDAYADRVPENRFGDLCHAVIEARLSNRSLDSGHADLLGLPEDARAPLLAEAERLAEGFFSSERAGIIAEAEELQVEKALLLSLGDYVIRARLDLVVVCANSVLVIDWKSGKESRAAAYVVQLALYRRALAALYPNKTVRSSIWWLRSATEEELSEEFSFAALEDFAAEAARVSESELAAAIEAP